MACKFDGQHCWLPIKFMLIVIYIAIVGRCFEAVFDAMAETGAQWRARKRFNPDPDDIGQRVKVFCILFFVHLFSQSWFVKRYGKDYDGPVDPLHGFRFNPEFCDTQS